MFSISIRQDNHIRRYSVSPIKGSGWEATLEEDLKLTRVTHYEDWHRVERALAVIRLEVGELTKRGWQKMPS